MTEKNEPLAHDRKRPVVDGPQRATPISDTQDARALARWEGEGGRVPPARHVEIDPSPRVDFEAGERNTLIEDRPRSASARGALPPPGTPSAYPRH